MAALLSEYAPVYDTAYTHQLPMQLTEISLSSIGSDVGHVITRSHVRSQARGDCDSIASQHMIESLRHLVAGQFICIATLDAGLYKIYFIIIFH